MHISSGTYLKSLETSASLAAGHWPSLLHCGICEWGLPCGPGKTKDKMRHMAAVETKLKHAGRMQADIHLQDQRSAPGTGVSHKELTGHAGVVGFTRIILLQQLGVYS